MRVGKIFFASIELEFHFALFFGVVELGSLCSGCTPSQQGRLAPTLSSSHIYKHFLLDALPSYKSWQFWQEIDGGNK